MALQSKWFFLEKYGNGGLNILVREGGSPTGLVLAETVVSGKEFDKLLDLLGIEQLEPDSDTPEPPEVEHELLPSSDEIAKKFPEEIDLPEEDLLDAEPTDDSEDDREG